MAQLRRITTAFAAALALVIVPACASENTSKVGQLIECDVAADGTTANCQPTDSTETSDPGKCVDVDEDGDDDPFDDESEDESEDESGDDSSALLPSDPNDTDDDDDGLEDAEDDDDDNDGVDDDDDCDEEAGGQDDEPDDDDSEDDDL